MVCDKIGDCRYSFSVDFEIHVHAHAYSTSCKARRGDWFQKKLTKQLCRPCVNSFTERHATRSGALRLSLSDPQVQQRVSLGRAGGQRPRWVVLEERWTPKASRSPRWSTEINQPGRRNERWKKRHVKDSARSLYKNTCAKAVWGVPSGKSANSARERQAALVLLSLRHRIFHDRQRTGERLCY